MELTKYAQAIKTELAMELAKQGSSLEEFEQALKNINNGEGVFKVASFGSTVLAETKAQEKVALVSEALSALGAVPELALKSTLAGGAGAGLVFDSMDKSVDSLNKALEHEREKVKLVRRLTQNLKREHGFA
jgi:hypothetical protein